jgi:hypothetical protein
MLSTIQRCTVITAFSRIKLARVTLRVKFRKLRAPGRALARGV